MYENRKRTDNLLFQGEQICNVTAAIFYKKIYDEQLKV